MNEQRYDIVDAVEDAAKVGYSLTTFACKAFYQVSNLEALKNGMDAYNASRFAQRLEHFTYEHNKLSKEQKKSFYDSLKDNKQNMNYLYEFLEKAKKTTFDIHARIYAVMSARLVKNGLLSYFENDLLSNMHLLNKEDIMHLAFILRVIDQPDGYCDNESQSFKMQVNAFKIPRPIKHLYILEHRNIEFLNLKPSHYYTYKKCIQIGIFDDMPIKQEGGQFGVIVDISEASKKDNKEIRVTENTCSFYKLLREVFPDDE